MICVPGLTFEYSCRQISLNKRLSLFRTTALPTFLLTVNPNRAGPSFCATTPSKWAVRCFLPVRWICLNSRVARIRYSGRQRKREDCTIWPTAKQQTRVGQSCLRLVFFGANSWSKNRTAFRSATTKNFTASGGAHASSKTMASLSTNITWLICAFHVDLYWLRRNI